MILLGLIFCNLWYECVFFWMISLEPVKSNDIGLSVKEFKKKQGNRKIKNMIKQTIEDSLIGKVLDSMRFVWISSLSNELRLFVIIICFCFFNSKIEQESLKMLKSSGVLAKEQKQRKKEEKKWESSSYVRV